MYATLRKGERVHWRGVNREYTGEVVEMTERGALVRLDGGERYIVLATEDTMQNFIIRRLANTKHTR